MTTYSAIFRGITPYFDVESARNNLSLLELSESVCLSDDGTLSTTTELSSGKRKRLALLSAYFDDRAIMIFDEWTADHDSTLRHVFHENLLPALHSKGKTLIIITHDERYFHCAHRLIKIEDGKLLTIHEHGPTEVNETAQAVAFHATTIRSHGPISSVVR